MQRESGIPQTKVACRAEPDYYNQAEVEPAIQKNLHRRSEPMLSGYKILTMVRCVTGFAKERRGNSTWPPCVSVKAPNEEASQKVCLDSRKSSSPFRFAKV